MPQQNLADSQLVYVWDTPDEEAAHIGVGRFTYANGQAEVVWIPESEMAIPDFMADIQGKAGQNRDIFLIDERATRITILGGKDASAARFPGLQTRAIRGTGVIVGEWVQEMTQPLSSLIINFEDKNWLIPQEEQGDSQHIKIIDAGASRLPQALELYEMASIPISLPKVNDWETHHLESGLTVHKAIRRVWSLSLLVCMLGHKPPVINRILMALPGTEDKRFEAHHQMPPFQENNVTLGFVNSAVQIQQWMELADRLPDTFTYIMQAHLSNEYLTKLLNYASALHSLIPKRNGFVGGDDCKDYLMQHGVKECWAKRINKLRNEGAHGGAPLDGFAFSAMRMIVNAILLRQASIEPHFRIPLGEKWCSR